MAQLGSSLDISEDLTHEMQQIEDEISQYGSVGSSKGTQQKFVPKRKGVVKETRREPTPKPVSRLPQKQNIVLTKKNGGQEKMQEKKMKKEPAPVKKEPARPKKDGSPESPSPDMDTSSGSDNSTLGKIVFVVLVLAVIYFGYQAFTTPATAAENPLLQCTYNYVSEKYAGATVLDLHKEMDGPRKILLQRALTTTNVNYSKSLLHMLACPTADVTDVTKIPEDYAECSTPPIVLVINEESMPELAATADGSNTVFAQLLKGDMLEGFTLVYKTTEPKVFTYTVQ